MQNTHVDRMKTNTREGGKMVLLRLPGWLGSAGGLEVMEVAPWLQLLEAQEITVGEVHVDHAIAMQDRSDLSIPWSANTRRIYAWRVDKEHIVILDEAGAPIDEPLNGTPSGVAFYDAAGDEDNNFSAEWYGEDLYYRVPSGSLWMKPPSGGGGTDGDPDPPPGKSQVEVAAKPPILKPVAKELMVEEELPKQVAQQLLDGEQEQHKQVAEKGDQEQKGAKERDADAWGGEVETEVGGDALAAKLIPRCRLLIPRPDCGDDAQRHRATVYLRKTVAPGHTIVILVYDSKDLSQQYWKLDVSPELIKCLTPNTFLDDASDCPVHERNVGAVLARCSKSAEGYLVLLWPILLGR